MFGRNQDRRGWWAGFPLWKWNFCILLGAVIGGTNDSLIQANIRANNPDDASAHPNLDLDLDSFYYETALHPSDGTLLASTLDGTLVALNQNSGEVLWELNDEPVVRSPYDSSKPVLPAFLPDPKDGSIYMIGGGLKDPLKKLPFTIPELVAASPCKSSDGILYTGKKVDTWFSVDRYTGSKQGSISFNGCVQGTDDQCPNLKASNFLIGRTEYNIMMFDSRAEGRKWNISFFDYSSNLAGVDVGPEYDLAHFTDSSTGSLVTLDRKSGVIEWERHIGSPIVAMYRLEGDGIVNVPFTSVSKETLVNLLEQFNMPDSNNEVIGETKLFPTLYVGEHDHGLYAMPSLVDEQTLTISPNTNGPLLLEGPQNFAVPSEINIEVISGNRGLKVDPLGIPVDAEDMPKDKSSVLLFGISPSSNNSSYQDGYVEDDLDDEGFQKSHENVEIIDNDMQKKEVLSKDVAIINSKGVTLNSIIGYYQVPEHSTIKLSPAVTQLQLTSTSQSRLPMRTQAIKGGVVPPIFPPVRDLGSMNQEATYQHEQERRGNIESSGKLQRPSDHRPHYLFTPRNDSKRPVKPTYDGDLLSNGWSQIAGLNMTFILSKDIVNFGSELCSFAMESAAGVVNPELKFIGLMLTLLVIVAIKMVSQNRGIYNVNGHMMSNSSVGSTGSQHSNINITATPINLESGHIKVGNIIFDPVNILGKGCEGTFVYKGSFDNREVAVKRVLNACFSITDREVELLRESDVHPNVIRYFCMEQDSQFKYIALEYCIATLQDYVDGKYVNPSLDSLTILRQATMGLSHLHQLDIVHRDIKPHNVLISTPGKKGDVRAMISDFGLCKKLKIGRNSFSRRSGLTGTEGWIAPEMMDQNKSTTCLVDIFSLGCVYYFVLTKGSHPFDDMLRRQVNILTHKYDLSKLAAIRGEQAVTATKLIEKMICGEPGQRPSCQAVLKHPLFWTREKVLNFLQDVSDRVDKEDYDSAILSALERHKTEVVRGNWHDILDKRVQADLRKHRSYNPKSVRDLLRALRNKKHHYNELPEETKALYGQIPDSFAKYWLSKFPQLLMHSWYTMHAVKNEPAFVKYFDKEFDFVQPAEDGSSELDKEMEESETAIAETTKLREDLKFLKPMTMNGISSSLEAEIRNSSSNAKSHLDEAATAVNRYHRRATIDGSKKLFEPHFLNKRGNDVEEEESPSRKSVISNWDDYVLKEDLEEEEREQEHLSPARRGAPLEECDERHPYLLTESPLSVDEPLAPSPRKVRKSVMQLESDAEEQRREREAALLSSAQPTYAERLRNITAGDKLKELSSVAAVDEEVEDEEQMQLCQNGSSALEIEEKENLAQNGALGLSNGSEAVDDGEEENPDDDVVRDENGEIKTVWKLPPEPEKKPSKKKKRKPKAST